MTQQVLNGISRQQDGVLAELDRLTRMLRGLLSALRGDGDDALEEPCRRCGGQGVTAACRCHSSAQCPAAIDETCDECLGEGNVPVLCGAFGCRVQAAGACPACEEPWCGRHRGDHAGCGGEATP